MRSVCLCFRISTAAAGCAPTFPRTLAEESSGGSTLPKRVLLLEEPPSIDANEITDKGYINQRAVLMRRAALVERLHAQNPDSEVIVAPQRERELLRA
jgi:hypothetical protein